ncbi:hypothetical protein [Sutterella megalosphaeroides]|uniref:Uncharacterized protein n=1 Tax=Sutterella megalosphaeroides TaxID=2494234 RepID=A0A2Z6I802_9BURK|nr:hypothetical protein [Sutterella megalosphaeroides]BBF22514.1 hypothetical protein SUTMEG_04050 [Sutterella megalosphaeroides]
MWNPFSRKTRTAPQMAPSAPQTHSDNPFGRAASAASDPLWFSDPEGRLALMALPASGTGVFALRGGLGLDGRVRELAERRANGDGTDFRAVIVTPEAAAEGLGAASTSVAEALGFEWERRLGLARCDLLWASGGPIGETLEVGTLIGAASVLREVATREAGKSDPPFGPLRRMPFRMPEGHTELSLWETPPAVDLARASVHGLHVGLPVRRNVLEVFAETLAPKLWAGLHPAGTAGDLLVITASGEGVERSGNASQPPVERWDDPRVEAISAGLTNLLEDALRRRALVRGMRTMLAVEGAETTKEAHELAESLWPAAVAAGRALRTSGKPERPSGWERVFRVALSLRVSEGVERSRLAVRFEGIGAEATDASDATDASKLPARIVVSFGRGRASVMMPLPI